MRTMKHLALAAAAAAALTLAGCGGGGGSSTSSGPTTPTMGPTLAEKETAATNALGAAKMDVEAVMDDSDMSVVDAADTAVAAAVTAVAAASDSDMHAEFSRKLGMYQGQLTSAKSSRTIAMADDKKAADMAMMQTAMKLHMGIGAPTAVNATPAATIRHAGYGAGDNANDIAVTIGGAEAVNLSEDKTAMVADNYGWMGKKYTRATPASEGMYEAVVYSNVGDPAEGDAFDEQYTLVDGALGETDTEGTASRVASSMFDQSAGVKAFKLPDNDVAVMIPGSFHRVSGTYSCVPSANNTCAVNIVEQGFALGGVDGDNTFIASDSVWTFKPSNPKAKVMSENDMIYASYGWWLHKSANGMTYTASAFVGDMGDVPDATGLTALRGTAKYMGGAAGKYALYSATGGTNDVGHFTAKATLDADFNTDMISGAIDAFMGADGKSRDWSVELKKTGIADSGAIAGLATEGTVWTIGGAAAAAAGQWSGSLQDNGDDGVPKVGTGTFHSEYSTSGRMVGAFGVNKQ